MNYQVVLTSSAQKMLQEITDRRIREKIRERIDQLRTDPDKQGKPLTDDLIGYRTVRAVGQRYRIIYQILHQQVRVIIIALGLRKEGSKKDIYSLAKKLIRLKLVK